MKRRLLVGLFAVVALTCSTARASWDTYQGNPAHTGYVPVTLDPENFSLRWDRTIRSQYALNPVTAAEGKVFVSELGYFDNAGLFVLDAATGETKWSITYGDIFSVNPPAYGYGNVYVQTGNHGDDTYLRAYNAETGAFVFRSPHTAQWERYGAPTLYDGRAYINGGYYGGMYSFDAINGQRYWFNDQLPQYDQWTPAVDIDYAYAYLGGNDAGLYVVDRITGVTAFVIPDPEFSGGYGMYSAPVLGGEENVLAIQNYRLINFDLKTRIISRQIRRAFTGQPTVARGVIYAIDAGALTAWQESNGQFLWGWEEPTENVTGTILATDSHVFVHTDTRVFAIDIFTHDDVWSYPAVGELALSEEALYIAGQAGRLIAINAPTSGTTSTVEPSHFSVTAGVLWSGELSHLFSSDDRYLVIHQRHPATVAAPNAALIVQGAAPSETALALRFQLESLASGLPPTRMIQRVEFFNYQSNSWEIMSERPPTSTDSIVRIIVTDNASRFIQPGRGKTVQARISWFDRGTIFPDWYVGIDQTIWEITY